MTRPLPLIIIAVAITLNVGLIVLGILNWNHIERFMEQRELNSWLDEVMTDDTWEGLEDYYEFAENRIEVFYEDLEVLDEQLGVTLWDEEETGVFNPEDVLLAHAEIRALRSDVAEDLIRALVPYLDSLTSEQRDAVIWSLYFHDDFPLVF